jgi:hypothetical protein
LLVLDYTVRVLNRRCWVLCYLGYVLF